MRVNKAEDYSMSYFNFFKYNVFALKKKLTVFYEYISIETSTYKNENAEKIYLNNTLKIRLLK